MYYSEDLVERIRQENDIVDVIGSYIRLNKAGVNYKGLCPFHNEKTPSFVVSHGKQMFKCFGCGKGGNVVSFVMEYENFTFQEAIEMLAKRVNIQLPKLEHSKEEKEKYNMRAQILDINKETAKYYFYLLKTNRGKLAYNYLKNRQLKDETIIHFGLGYSGKSNGELYKYLKGKGYDDNILSKTGLFTFDERGVQEKFWNRVMFPIMDVNKKVIGFGGRVMGDAKPKYLNSQETIVFDKSRNLYGLMFARNSKRKNILICEGYMDVIALHQAGFDNAVASLGTAFTSLQANILKRYLNEDEYVLLSYDNDKAGLEAILKANSIIKDVGLNTKVIDMQPYKDPDEFIKNLGAEEFEKRIENAQNGFLAEIQIIQKKYNIKEPSQKTLFINDMVKRIVEFFSDDIERNNYVEALADKYNIDYNNLKKMVNNYGMKRKNINIVQSTYSNIDKKISRNRIEEAKRMFLEFLCNDLNYIERVKNVIQPDEFGEGIYKDLVKEIFLQYENEKKIEPAKILDKFEDKEENLQVAQILNSNLNLDVHAEKEKEKAFINLVKLIKKANADDKFYKLSKEQMQAKLMEYVNEKKSIDNLRF